MRELYKKYYHIPKHGEIQDKVMLVRTVITAVVMIICLAVISGSAYAYFSHSVTSSSNVIKAANFEVEVSIRVAETKGTAEVDVKNTDNAGYTAKLEAGKIYTVTIDESDNSTSRTGFCIVTANGCSDIYRTQQLGVDESVKDRYTDKITFQLKVTSDTTVTFLSYWGTSSYYNVYREKGKIDKLYITNANIGDNAVEMVVSNALNSIGESGKEETTIPDTDSATVTDPLVTTEPESTTPSVETTQPADTTTPETTEPSDPITTEPPSTTEPESTTPSVETTQPTDTTTPETTGPSDPTTTEPPSTTEPESTTPSVETTQPADTTTPETTGPSDPTTTEPPSTTEPESTTPSVETTQPTDTTTPETTEPSETTSATEQTQTTTEA